MSTVFVVSVRRRYISYILMISVLFSLTLAKLTILYHDVRVSYSDFVYDVSGKYLYVLLCL